MSDEGRKYPSIYFLYTRRNAVTQVVRLVRWIQISKSNLYPNSWEHPQNVLQTNIFFTYSNINKRLKKPNTPDYTVIENAMSVYSEALRHNFLKTILEYDYHRISYHGGRNLSIHIFYLTVIRGGITCKSMLINTSHIQRKLKQFPGEHLCSVNTVQKNFLKNKTF